MAVAFTRGAVVWLRGVKHLLRLAVAPLVFALMAGVAYGVVLGIIAAISWSAWTIIPLVSIIMIIAFTITGVLVEESH